MFKITTFKSNFQCSAVEPIESPGQFSVSSVVWVESWRRGVAAADRMTLGTWDNTKSTHHHEHIKHAAEQSTFADKAASLGLHVTLAAKARNEELYKLQLFAVTQLEWLARDDSNHVQFSAACVAGFGCLQHFPPEDVYDTNSYRTFLTLHWQHHTHIARPSKHQTMQAETITANTTCVLWVGTTLVLQPEQLPSVFGIAVALFSTLYAPHFTLALHALDFTLHFTLHTLHFTLHTLRFTLSTPHFTLLTPHSTLHTLQSPLFTFHFALLTPHTTLYTLHFALHSLRSTLYTLYCALYTLHCSLHSSLHALRLARISRATTTSQGVSDASAHLLIGTSVKHDTRYCYLDLLAFDPLSSLNSDWCCRVWIPSACFEISDTRPTALGGGFQSH